MTGTRPSVFARVRPAPTATGSSLFIHGNTITLKSQQATFALTGVHDNATQEAVYLDAAPTVDAALQGINATIFTCAPGLPEVIASCVSRQQCVTAVELLPSGSHNSFSAAGELQVRADRLRKDVHSPGHARVPRHRSACM